MRRFVAVIGIVCLTSVASAQSGGSNRVTGGSEAPLGAWPDAAGMVFGGRSVNCTGTLIAPDVVVTAAHCIDQSLRDVIVGSNDWFSDQGEVIGVQARYVHPTADIAVLKLSRESNYEPRPIAMGCIIDDYLEDGAPVAVVGFGTTNAWGTEGTSLLMEGFTVVTDHDCSATSRGCQGAISPGGEIGAGGDGVDACFGDSGGPLYLQTDIGDYLVGVTSRAFNDVNPPCGLGGIWVRPDSFVEWIEDRTDVDIPVPTCTMFPLAADAFLRVRQNRAERLVIDVDDEDSEVFTFAVAQQPEHGTVGVNNFGETTYTPDTDYLGLDTFAILVTDTTGYPLGSDIAVIEVEVVEKSFLGCACQSSAAPSGALWMVGLLGLVAGRRRRQNLSA